MRVPVASNKNDVGGMDTDSEIIFVFHGENIYYFRSLFVYS